MFKKIFFIVGLITVMYGCGKKNKTIFTDTLVVDDKYKPHEDTVLIDSIRPILFSRLHRPNSFGMRTAYQVPTELQGKKMYVVVSGRSRNNYAHSNAVIVVVTHNAKNEQLSWDFIRMKYQYTEVNYWCNFKDSLKLPPDFYGKEYNLITVMAHLPEGAEKFDLDGLKVEIKANL